MDFEWTPSGLVARRATVLPITDEIAPSPRVMAAAASAERDLEAFLGTIIGELAQPLDFAYDRECGVGDLTADALRERMDAEVAVLAIGHAFSGPLPAGPLARGTLWDVCASPANPGVTTITGAQLLEMVRRGLDPTRAAHVSRVTRGTPQGIFHLSGATVRAGRLYVGDAPLDPQRSYRIAGTDWELDSEDPIGRPRRGRLQRSCLGQHRALRHARHRARSPRRLSRASSPRDRHAWPRRRRAGAVAA